MQPRRIILFPIEITATNGTKLRIQSGKFYRSRDKRERPPFLGRRPFRKRSLHRQGFGFLPDNLNYPRPGRDNGFTLPSFLPFLTAFAFAMIVYLLFVTEALCCSS